MPDNRLSHDEFFGQLTDLFEARRAKDHGSIYLTQKRLSPPESAAVSTIGKDPDPLADLKPPSEPLPVLIRATDGKGKSSRTDKSKKTDRRKVKLSTVVLQEELEGFFTKYTEVCKAGMSSGLKKRDRKAREKKKKKGKGGPSGSGDKT